MPLLDADLDGDVREQLPLLTVGRLVGNGILRLAVPFLGTIGRSLGVPIATMGEAASAGEFTGLLAPVIGRRLDRGHHGRAMTAGMAVLTLGALVAALSPSALVIGIAFVLVAVGKLLYDPAFNAWVAERVPYERRARVIGVIELSWAGSMLVIVPLAGIVVALAGWRWAYAILAGAAAVMTVAVHRRPGGNEAAGRPVHEHNTVRITASVAAGLVGFGLLMAASNACFVVFGVWLHDAFGYPPAVIGLVGVLLGLIELAATAGTIRFTDRIGKRTAVVLGAVLMVPTAAALGATGHRAWLGLTVFALFVLGFEFAIVSGLPLVVELLPDARAAGLGLAIGLGTVGRGIMSIVSTRVYDAHGIGGSGLLGAACAVAVIGLYGLVLGRHERLR